MSNGYEGEVISSLKFTSLFLHHRTASLLFNPGTPPPTCCLEHGKFHSFSYNAYTTSTTSTQHQHSTARHHAPRSITQHHAAPRSTTQHHAASPSITQHHPYSPCFIQMTYNQQSITNCIIVLLLCATCQTSATPELVFNPSKSSSFANHLFVTFAQFHNYYADGSSIGGYVTLISFYSCIGTHTPLF